MALRDITQKKAYQARKTTVPQIAPLLAGSENDRGTDFIDMGQTSTKPSSSTSGYSPDMYGDDSFASANSKTISFNYSTPTATQKSSTTTPTATKSSPLKTIPTTGSAYKSNITKNGGTTINKDTGTDLLDFGDVNANGNKYKGVGYDVPTLGKNIDITKVPELGAIGQEFDRFGKQAELMERQSPGFLNKRNDAYLAELARKNPDFNTLDESSQKQAISDLLQQRDTKGELFSGSKGQQDVLNTINSIYNRIGQGKSQNQLMNEKATQLYDKEQGNIDSMYQVEKNNFLKAGAIEDRFTNFNEVDSKIQKTLLTAGQHRIDNLYTGTPNDSQIGEIAQSLGQDFATTKRILEGRGYEDLQLQDEFKKEASQDYDRAMEDLNTNTERAIEDADIQHQRTQELLDQNIEDTKLQMEQDLAMGEMAGALSGAVRSSGYMQGLDAIKAQYTKNIGRLQERQARDTEDTVMNKKRISETAGLNATRNKENLDNTLKSIKMKAGLEMSQYLNEFAPSSTELERKLNEITNKYGILSQEAFGKYTENIRGITDTMTYDTEKVMELQQKKQTLQQVTVGNLLADNGMALAGLSKNDLQTMVQNGTISNTDYTAMTGYMQSLGIATLQSKGVPTQEDISLYTSLLDKGLSPQQAITTVMSKNPSRYIGGGTTNNNSSKTVKTPNGTFQYNPTTDRYDIPVGSDSTTTKSNNGGGQVRLNETPKDTGIKNVYGGSVKLASTVGAMVQKANNILSAKGINIKIGDSYRSNAVQKQVYESGKEGVAAPGKSFHEIGQAFDLSQRGVDGMNNEVVFQALRDAGLQQHPNERWHRSYGEFGGNPGVGTGGTAGNLGLDEVITFNDDVTRRKMSKEDVKRIGDAKKEVMSNPDSSISDIMYWSSGGKSVGAEQSKVFDKFSTVMGQLDTIESQISKINTGPIVGKLKSMNPRDTDVGVLKAQLTALVPGLARGVYGEVGVLTDEDVRLYAQTIPNLKGTKVINDGVLAFTLDLLAAGYKKKLSSLAGQGYDVSGLEGEYENIIGQANDVKNRIGLTTPEQNAKKGQDLFNKVSSDAIANNTNKGTTTTTQSTTNKSTTIKTLYNMYGL